MWVLATDKVHSAHPAESTSATNDEQEPLIKMRKLTFLHILLLSGARGGVVVKALRYKRQVAGSIPDGVIGIFQ
jgi:hypothetical protein